jgi:vacuolar protein sorting-associated protein 54
MPNNTTPPRASIDNTRMSRTASGVKLAYLASSQQQPQQQQQQQVGSSNATTSGSDSNITTPSGNNSTSPTPPIITTTRPLARERPFARDDYNNNSNSNSRPPSIRSATSFGRPINRFIPGQHARHHSNYSNFSTMSETALPWTTRDIGFNAISGNIIYGYKKCL